MYILITLSNCLCRHLAGLITCICYRYGYLAFCECYLSSSMHLRFPRSLFHYWILLQGNAFVIRAAISIKCISEQTNMFHKCKRKHMYVCTFNYARAYLLSIYCTCTRVEKLSKVASKTIYYAFLNTLQ